MVITTYYNVIKSTHNPHQCYNVTMCGEPYIEAPSIERDVHPA